MLALCNDVDEMRLSQFREIHRFLNTLEETTMGPGVGLDVGDSLWFYHPPSPDPSATTVSYGSATVRPRKRTSSR